MALMFSRVARNFIRNGYFPTDEVTLARVLQFIEPVSSGSVRILDPCAGEGSALAEFKHHLGAGHTEAFAIEFDAERATQAAQLTDPCLHSDVQDCILTERAFGALWLNPPYGFRVTDTARTSDDTESRLEKLFYRRTVGSLQWGGVLVLIIPSTTIDSMFATWLARSFEDIQLFRAATDQFRQVVFLGRRRRSAVSGWQPDRDRLIAVGRGDQIPEVIPEVWDGELYRLPLAPRLNSAPIQVTRFTPEQLQAVVSRCPVLWSGFAGVFQPDLQQSRPPLREPSDWHLALLLSAGQLDGVTQAADGERYALRGHTWKVNECQTTVELDPETGKTTEVRTVTERFLPVIRLLQITPGSPHRGRLLTVA